MTYVTKKNRTKKVESHKKCGVWTVENNVFVLPFHSFNEANQCVQLGLKPGGR